MSSPSPLEPNWTRKHTAGCLVSVLGIVLVGLVPIPTLIMWWLFILLMGAFTVIASDGVTDSYRGLLIDERHRMDLSRLQMVLWTLLIVPAFLAASIGNVRIGAVDPLEIAIPQAVWVLLGISTTTLVGSPLLLAAKQVTPPIAPPSPLIQHSAEGESDASMRAASPTVSRGRVLPAATAAMLQAQGEDPGKMVVMGSVVCKESTSDASWSDLFKGDEVGNVAILDLAKVQMFFFTLVLILSYAIALGAKLGAHKARINGFPPLDMGFVTILGISNAGFLANHAIPRPQTPG